MIMARPFNPEETFGRMWRAMGKNIDWAQGPEGQRLLQTIKQKGSSPSFGTGDLFSRFQNDLMTGQSTVRGQVADMYNKYYGTGTPRPPAPATTPQVTPRPQTTGKGGALVRSPGGSLVDQAQRITTNTNVPTPGPSAPRLSGGSSTAITTTARPAQAAQAQGFLKQTLGRLGPLLGGAFRGLDAMTVVDKNADPRDRGIAAGGVVHPMLGLALSGMAAFDDKITELTGVSSQGPGAGRGEGYRLFSPATPRKGKSKAQPTSQNIAPPSESQSVVPVASVSTMTTLSDGSRRSSDGGTVYSADGKRYTTNGVTYDLGTGQSVNPATNKTSENGYSIAPGTGERVDAPATPSAPPTVKTNMADASELERYKVWVGANEGLAKKVKPGQAGYEEIQSILGAKEGGPSAEERLNLANNGITTSDLNQTFEVPQGDGTLKISGIEMNEVAKGFAQDYIERVKKGEVKTDKPDAPKTPATAETAITPEPTEPAATPAGAYEGVDIGKIRISNAEYNKMTGPLGDFIPQLKGLGTETTYDPVTKSWRILATTDSTGATKTYN